jgi:peptidoglycan hydrolase-like protein with peptidoglycan-binding domain
MKTKQKLVLVRGIVVGSVLMFMSVSVAFAQQQAATTKKPSTSMDTQTQTMQSPKSQAGMQKSASQGKNMGSSMMQDKGKMQKLSKQEVKSVQEALNKDGYNLQEDGILGKNTHNAIKNYQKKNQLKETGRLDAETMSKLNLK